MVGSWGRLAVLSMHRYPLLPAATPMEATSFRASGRPFWTPATITPWTRDDQRATAAEASAGTAAISDAHSEREET
jgi:hypothetical protein